MNAIQQKVLDDLGRDGIATVRFQDLLGEALWDEAAADIAPFVAATDEKARELGSRSHTADKEEVIVRRFHSKAAKGDAHRFPLSSPWLRAAASDSVLDVVNAYCGSPARLTYVDNWYTVPYPDAPDRVASQRWHRDPEDSHIVKMFVYFSDVDEGAGPFEYVRGSAEGGTYGSLFSWADGYGYPPPDELEAAVDEADRLTMTGPAGTVIFCDTAGFHRGGFARTSPRILSIATFLRPTAKKGKRRFAVDFEGGEESLSDQARHALSG